MENPGNSIYSSSAPDNSKAELSNKGFNLNIEQVTPVAGTSLDPKKDNIVDSIVQTAALNQQSEKKVLDELQKMDAGLNLNLPIGPQVEQSAKLAKLIFLVTLIVSALAIGYFAFSNSNQFFAALGVVAPSQDTLERQSVENLRYQKITNNLLSSAILIEKISYDASQFAVIVNSDAAVLSVAKKNQLKKNLQTNLEQFKVELGKAIEELNANPDLEPDLILFMSDQLAKLSEQISSATSNTLKAELNRKKALLEDAIKLMQQKDLESKIDIEKLKNITDADLLKLIQLVLSASDKNSLAKVAKVQLARISWTGVFDEIESIMKKLDPTFNVFRPSKDGVIVLTGYSFSSDDGKISLSGTVTTQNEDTFSVIANTVDALENSSMFKDITYWSYSKALQEGQGFRSSVNFAVKLENHIELATPTPNV